MSEGIKEEDKAENQKIEMASERLRNGLGRSRNLFFENEIKCEWLSTNEAARFLVVSENALRIMVHRDQIPAYKFGRRLRFRLKDCQALIKRKGA